MIKDYSPVSRIVASLCFIICFIVPLYYYISGIVSGSLGVGLIVLFGLLLLFYCPFMLIGGVQMMREAIDELKNKGAK